MAHPFPFPKIFRVSNTINDRDDEHLVVIRAAIAHGKEVLATNPLVDTFAGRKTYDPFPNEDDIAFEETSRLVAAYEQTLRALGLIDRNDPVTEIVAKKIIKVGIRGGDALEISKLALKELGVPEAILSGQCLAARSHD